MLLLFAVGLLAVPGALIALVLSFPPKLARTAVALTTMQYGLGAGLLPFCLGVTLIGLGLVRRPLS